MICFPVITPTYEFFEKNNMYTFEMLRLYCALLQVYSWYYSIILQYINFTNNKVSYTDCAGPYRLIQGLKVMYGF